MLDSSFRVQMLGAEVLSKSIEPDQAFTPQEVLSWPTQAFIHPSVRHNFLFGLSKRAHWLRYQIHNHSGQAQSLVLEIVNPNIQELRHYQFRVAEQASLLRADTLGVKYGFGQRPIQHQNFQIPIQMEAEDTLTCLLYLPPMALPLNFNLFLWGKTERQTTQKATESLQLQAFFLIHFIFLTLLVIIARVFRQRALGFYAAYVFLGALLVWSDLGLGYRFIWKDWPYLQTVAGFFSVNVYLILGTQFIREHFQTAQRHPRFDRVFLAAIGLTVVLLTFVLILPYLPLYLAHALEVAHYLVFLATSSAFVVLFLRTITQRRRFFSGWFLLAFSLHGASIVFTILQFLSLLPEYSFAHWMHQRGFAFTLYTPASLMLGMILEIPIVLFIGIKRFKYLVELNVRQAGRLAKLRTENANALLQGIETERRRLAQDLHDGLSVNLAAIKMKANLMEVKAEAQERPAWREIMQDLEQVYEELRRVARNLVPKALYHGGLPQALEELVQRTRMLRPEMQVRYYYNLPRFELNQQAEIHLYRITLELINNVLRHAEASELTVQLTKHEQQIILMAEDNGKGMDRAFLQKKEEGIGLSNIRNRAELLGGSLSIDSQLGRGTTVIVELPLEGLENVQEKPDFNP
jgi:signal transduction histidine kinase